MSRTKLEFWKWFFTRTTARNGPLSTSFTSSALSRSQCCFSKSASIFHASHCLGLSTKVCSKLPHTRSLGPPVSVSEGANVSIWLRLSNKLSRQPLLGSILRRMNSFSSESADAFTADKLDTGFVDARTKHVL